MGDRNSCVRLFFTRTLPYQEKPVIVSVFFAPSMRLDATRHYKDCSDWNWMYVCCRRLSYLTVVDVPAASNDCGNLLLSYISLNLSELDVNWKTRLTPWLAMLAHRTNELRLERAAGGAHKIAEDGDVGAVHADAASVHGKAEAFGLFEIHAGVV